MNPSYMKHGLLLSLIFGIITMVESRSLHEIDKLLKELIESRSVQSDDGYESNWSENQQNYITKDDRGWEDDKEKRSSVFFSTRQCVLTSKRSLHAQLQQMDTFNDMYLAPSAEEAALFPSLNWNARKRDDYMYIIRRLRPKILKVTNGNIKLINRFKRYLENKLGLDHYEVISNDDTSWDEREKKNTPSCIEEGHLDNNTNAYVLCTSCEKLSRMPSNVYPEYVNEVECKGSDTDNKQGIGKEPPTCLKGEGICKLREFKVSFLERTNNCKSYIENGVTKYLQEWKFATKHIGAGCECQVSKGSYLAGWVPIKKG